LEAIGAVTATDSRKALSRSGNYQECVVAPLSQETDDIAVLQDPDDNEISDSPLTGSDVILTSVDKVRS
jgi:hypothetical protein